MSPSSHSLVIRKCHDTELNDALTALQTAFETVRSIYRPSEKIVNGQAKRDKEGTRLIAEIDQQIVGTVQIADHKNHAHIIGLAVHPNFRRQGISQRLLHLMLENVRQMGHDTVVLETIKETGNVPIFEKLGFKVCDEQITYDFISDQFTILHEVRMELQLNNPTSD